MEFRASKQFASVKIFFSEVHDGPMNRSFPEGKENVRRFLRKIAAKKPFSSCGQPHGTRIEVISKPGFYESSDGLITKGPASRRRATASRGGDYVLAVKTADCVPLLLHNAPTETIGAIHVSRNNLIEGIISRSLARAMKKIGASPLSTKFFLGPHIRRENYPQKEEKTKEIVRTRFKDFLVSQNSKTYFDLTAALISELEEIKAVRDNIIDCGIDTYFDERFYSARRLKEGENLYCFLSVIFK